MAAELKPDATATITPPPGADLQPDAGAEITAPSGTLRRVGDAGIALAKGIVGLPEAAVGIADLATGGRVGKALENKDGVAGFRPKQAKEYLDTLKSPEQKAADRQVSEAEGFLPTLGAMAQNPSTIVGAGLESAPSMLAGGVLSRGVLAVAPRLGAITAGAIGEGGVAAGQNAEQVRQESEDGLLTAGQSGILAASGALTAGISRASGGVANRLGIGDVQTMLARGKLGAVGEEAATAGANKGLLRQAAEGFAVEGGLQELPQSMQEQAAQNLAQGKPLMEGVGAAGAQGLLVGGATGGLGAVAGSFGERAPAAPPTSPFSAALGLPAPGTRPTSPPGAGPADRGGVAGAFTVSPDGTVLTPEGRAQAASEQTLAEQSNPRPRSVDGLIETGMLGTGYPVTDVTPRGPTSAALASVAPGTQLLPPAPEPTTQVRAQEYADADSADRAMYDQIFGTQDATDVEAKTPRAVDALVDANINWDALNEGGQPVDDATFLRSMGASEDEIQDALNHANRTGSAPRSVPSSPATQAAGPEATSSPAGAAQNAGSQQTQTQGVANEQEQPTARAPAAPAPAPVAPAPAPAAERPARLADRQPGVATGGGGVGGVDGDGGGGSRLGASAPKVKADPKDLFRTAAQRVAARTPLTEHVTGKGKTLRGVVRQDMTLEQAKGIDPYAFKKDGGVFIREAHLDKLAARDADVKGTADPAPASTSSSAPAAVVPPSAPAIKAPAAAPAPAVVMPDDVSEPLVTARLSPGKGRQMVARGWLNPGKPNEQAVIGTGTTEADALADLVRDADAKRKPLGMGSLEAKRSEEEKLGKTPTPYPWEDATSAPTVAPEPAAAPAAVPAVKANTIFTEDAAAAARARMKKKLGTLNSGIDPELLQDGITLAGYHIEKGARTFAAYARAMLDDMGEGIRPYLKQLYMAVKFDPRAVEMGMDSAASVETADVDAIAASADEPAAAAPTPAAEPATRMPRPGSYPRASAWWNALDPAQRRAVQMEAGYSRDGNRTWGSYTDDMGVTLLGAGSKLAAQAPAPAAAPAAEVTANTGAAAAPLYSQMRVAPSTVQELTNWAKSQGFTSVVDDMHVTVGYSSKPVDASAVPLAKPLTLPIGGKTSVQTLGDGGAVVLMLPENPGLMQRHQALRDAGASWDFPTYQPHITITYDKGDVNLAEVRPYRGPINLMAEERSPLDPEVTAETQAAKEKPIASPAPAPAPAAAPSAPSAPAIADRFYDAIAAGKMPANNLALKKMVAEFDGKAPDQVRMKEAQEALESAIARTARDVISTGDGVRATFDELLGLYGSQPLLNVRTSTSIANQAYSTPAPLAFLASELAGITRDSTVYEPTAGTGMLLIGAQPINVHANELNDERRALLRAQGSFQAVTPNDATDYTPKGRFDAVIANPPFGSVKNEKNETIKVPVDGYRLGQIDHVIAARALEAMKADGRAVLILGANKVAGGQSNDDLVFFNWLYGHYNVAAHFEVAGDLYQRQGAGWPVRVITIDGRQASTRIAPAVGSIQRAENWDQVYEQFNRSVDSIGRPDGDASQGAGSPVAQQARPGNASDAAGRQPAAAGGQRPGSVDTSNGNVARASAGAVADRTDRAAPAVGAEFDDQRLGAEPIEPSAVERARPTDTNGAAQPAGNSGAAALSSDENQFQAKYVPRSSRKDEGVLIPVNMQQPTQDALSALEDAVGNIDQYAARELGYKDVAELHQAFMGLQVDSVASAIYQIGQGKGVVIADQTGIGKGRQAAAIIRWAVKNGNIPVFVSVKPSLFTDMYGDLADIGTSDVRPFILNSSEWISGADGEKLFANKPTGHRGRLEAIRDSGTLPEGANAVFMTYSQINQENAQRGALTTLAPNAIFVLDESHNAAGESNTGEFVRGLLDAAKGVTYLSATYAKRPDNMPLYFKTDIGKAAADNEGLMNAMSAGGLPLQTVVSNNLVKAGQMFRRERSYDGVSIESVIDTDNRVRHEKISDATTVALRAIAEADSLFHNVFVKEMSKRMAKEGGKAIDNAGNQVKAGVEHTEFSSVVHNFVKQMLLGLKAQTAAERAIKTLKEGKKPIIAVENTMGSFLNEYAEANGLKDGDGLGNFSYRTVLSRALARSRVLTEQKPNGEKVKVNIRLDQLDPLTRQTYDKAQAIIDGLDADIPVSPLDWMRKTLTDAGYTVAEITGRKLAVDYSTPKAPTLTALDVAEQKDKVLTTRKFNDGRLDALILNVAGSTGISLHASEKFQDQRPRHMIVAQPAGDINIVMQMLGRIHRTGQVVLPSYDMLAADLPTEKRPTALLSKKMKSLNANTSSNTESATSVKSQDMLNKYGDQVVGQYLADNYPLSRALGVDTPLGENGPEEDVARKATGRLALQPIAVQKQFYEEVESQYEALIDYLNKTGQNDLEPRTLDLDARETRQEVLFSGEDPTSPFGQDAIYGEYSIKAQGTAMTPAQINEAMAEKLEGKTPKDHVMSVTGPLMQAYTAYRATLDPDNHEAADATARLGTSFIDSHAIGDKFRVDINGESYNAVVTNIRSTHKANGNPFSMSKIQVSIALNGALRSLSVPATQFEKITVSSIQRGFTIEQLFKEQPANQRETAKIVTGNLLAAYGEMEGGARGTIISFTKQDGTTEQGILMPKSFDFAKDTRGDVRLPTGAQALRFLQTSQDENIGRFGIMSRDQVVRVLPAGQGIRIQVPKSKLRGGKYFLDKGLIAAAGDFVSSGDRMVATVTDPAQAQGALDLLMKKQALYALPSMAEEARASMGEPGAMLSIDDVPAIHGAAFDSWFGESKVVDESGKPLVVYHGTTADIQTFDQSKPGSNSSYVTSGFGTFVSESPQDAESYTRKLNGVTMRYESKDGANVMPLYAAIKKPFAIDRDDFHDFDMEGDAKGVADLKKKLQAQGYDGMRIDELTWVAFEPTQIKSATGNAGTFDATNPDITMSAAPAAALDAESYVPTESRNVPTKDATANHQAKAATMQERLRKQFNDPSLSFTAVEPDNVPGVLGQSLQAVRSTASRLFGHDVVFVKFAPGQRPLFNGAVSVAIPGTVFIRVDATRPHLAILGHELMHQLRTLDPRLYRALDTRLQKLYKAGAANEYFQKIRAAYESQGKQAPREWDEEMNADIVGDNFLDPAFWQALAQQGEPGQFRLIANAILRFIQRLKNLMTGNRPFGTEQYLSDLDAARDAVIEAMGKFSADQIANPTRRAVPAARSDLYSVEEGDDVMLSITADPKKLMDTAREGVATFLNTPGKLNWWHKTVGSPYNMAQRSPAFKKVFDGVQDFIKDVSKYATEAADLAPRILPQLNTLADLKKAPLSAADTKAISRATFEGTLTWTRDESGRPIKMADLEARYKDFDAKEKAGLMLRRGLVAENELKRWQALPIDSYQGAVRNRFEATVLKAGVVWKPAELKSMFGLDDRQVGLYQEGRRALDKSITDLALSDMVRFGGKDLAPLADQIMDTGDVVKASEMARDYLTSMAQADPVRSNVLMDTANKMIDKSDRAADLIKRGYAPLSRFGTLSLDVVDANGERAYFGLFESRLERAAMAKRMAAEFPGATIRQGTVSEESHKLFAGVTPETLELFGDMLGLEAQGDDASSQAFQQYLKLAKGNRSSMKRLIERKGIAGFDEDFGRVLAGFITSNARQVSGNLHTGQIQQATQDIPQGQGEVKDAAIKLAGYVSNPQEEAGGFRGLLFTQYIGGSIASAMVNLTQPLQTTLPYLSQFGGVRGAASQVRKAVQDAMKKATGDDALDRALKRADESGITLPQEIHQLQGQASGKAQLQAGDGTRTGNATALANNTMSRVQLGWGKLFSTAEGFNRRVTFIAAYRTAQAQNIADPFAFAEKAIAETQFVANKGNRPRWARGAVGAVLFTFKSYSVNYIELLGRMATAGEPGSPERVAGQKAAALMLATLFIMGGAGGLPFVEDVGDLIDGLMQRLGWNFNTKQKRQELLESLFGQAGAQFVDKGLSGISGMPIDVSGRMGMGNLLPGTGFLTKKADYGRDTAELFGPAGDFVKRAGTGAGQIVEGKPLDAVFSMAPKAIGNLRQGLDMATTGMYRDQKGKKIVDTNGWEAAVKAIGFQPNDVARVQDATFTQQNAIAQNRLASTEITDKWAQGIALRDPAMVKEAQEMLREWNAKNPDTPIRPSLSGIQTKARTLMMDKAARIAKTAPKAMREGVKEAIAREVN